MTESDQEPGCDGEEVVAAAVEAGNIPTLLMTLVQLSGDRRWLGEPYRPQRGVGLDDNDSGGLPELVQQEIRAAAGEAIAAWQAGRPPALADLSGELAADVLSAGVGEAVSAEFAARIAEAVRAGREINPAEPAVTPPPGFSAVVIGAGFAGLCAAVTLKTLGVPFTHVEKNGGVGGVWLDNGYPGAGVDTPAHLYEFSFAPHDWSQFFPSRDEVLSYLDSVAERFDLKDRIEFGQEVVSVEYDEARARWTVVTKDAEGNVYRRDTSIVISAVGAFNPPKVPDIRGLAKFAGKIFHTAEWPADANLTGLRVAIVGNGASAMQVVPAISDTVSSLTIFQRSPHWIAPFPKLHVKIPAQMRLLMRCVPAYHTWWRQRQAWLFDRLRPALIKDPAWRDSERSINAWNDKIREIFTKYIEEQLAGRPDLIERCTPSFPPYSKRMLLDHGWYKTLMKPHVELVDGAVVEAREHSLLTADGREFESDAVVLATGFDVSKFLSTYKVIGRDGRSLREVWDATDPQAYLGIAVPNFPNFFMFYGPNLQPGGGGSIVFNLEAQAHYLAELLKAMFREEVAVVECREEVHNAYNRQLIDELDKLVFTQEGLQTYFRSDRGRVVVINPRRNVDFWWLTRTADLGDYIVTSVTDTCEQGATYEV